MDKNSRIDTAAMAADRRRIEEEIKKVRAQTDALKLELKQISEQTNTADASSCYAEILHDLEIAEGTCRYLDEYLVCLKEAEKAYTACEAKMLEAADRIRI